MSAAICFWEHDEFAGRCPVQTYLLADRHVSYAAGICQRGGPTMSVATVATACNHIATAQIMFIVKLCFYFLTQMVTTFYFHLFQHLSNAIPQTLQNLLSVIHIPRKVDTGAKLMQVHPPTESFLLTRLHCCPIHTSVK